MTLRGARKTRRRVLSGAVLAAENASLVWTGFDERVATSTLLAEGGKIICVATSSGAGVAVFGGAGLASRNAAEVTAIGSFLVATSRRAGLPTVGCCEPELAASS